MRPRLSRSVRSRLAGLGGLAAAAVSLLAAPAAAQVVELDLNNASFHEPSTTSQITVHNPDATLTVLP